MNPHTAVDCTYLMVRSYLVAHVDSWASQGPTNNHVTCITNQAYLVLCQKYSQKNLGVLTKDMMHRTS